MAKASEPLLHQQFRVRNESDVRKVVMDCLQDRRRDGARFIDPLVSIAKSDHGGLGLAATQVILKLAGQDPSAVSGQVIPMLSSSSRRLQTLGVQLLKTPAGRAVFQAGLEGP